MKVLRNCIKDTFVDSMACDRNFSHNPFLLLGNESDSSTKIIMTIDMIRIYEIWRKYSVTKVELCMFLKDIRYCSNKKNFILNIRSNHSDVNISKVTYDTAPKVSRIKHRYRISNICLGKYVYFDITYLVRKWMETRGCAYGLTISADEPNYLLAFQSTKNRMKPLIRIFYNKNSCRRKESDITSRERYLNDFASCRERGNEYSDEYIKDRYIHHREESECNRYYDETTDDYPRNSKKHKRDVYDRATYKDHREVYDNDNLYSDDDRIFSSDVDIDDEEVFNRDEELDLYRKDFLREIEEMVRAGSDKSYGSFINLSTKLISSNDKQYVYWDTASASNNIEILRDKTAILVKNRGVYKIDYYINAKTADYTTMEIVLNDMPIDISRTQVGGRDTASSGQIIIEVEEDNSEINLIINSRDAILINLGRASCISIIEL